MLKNNYYFQIFTKMSVNYAEMSIPELQELLKGHESRTQRLCRAWACAIDVVTAKTPSCDVYILNGVKYLQYYSKLYGEIVEKYHKGEIMADTDNVNELMMRISQKSCVFNSYGNHFSPSESLEPFINLLVGDDDDDGEGKIIQSYLDIKLYETRE